MLKAPNLILTKLTRFTNFFSYKFSGSERSFRKPESMRSDRRRDYKSERSSRRDRNIKIEDDTPRPTPAHKYNSWMKDRRKTGATPQAGKEEDLKWSSKEDVEMWEEEQKRIDREW